MSKERIHKYTFALTLLFIFGAAGIFVFNTQSPTGYVAYDSSSEGCTYNAGGCNDINKWCYNNKCLSCSSGFYNCDDVKGCESTTPCEEAVEEVGCTSDADCSSKTKIKKYCSTDIALCTDMYTSKCLGGECSVASYLADTNCINCQNGCQNDACLDEEVTSSTKPSVCEDYFDDTICDDSAADCGTYYKSGTSLDACDECQTWKDGKQGFDKCEGGWGTALLEGKTKVYPLAGKSYEVTLDYVSFKTAVFTVNGELTPPLSIGKSDELADGTVLTLTEIIYQGTADGVKAAMFILDAPIEVETEEDTCQNSCGSKSEGDCYCDTACVNYGDCCSDYQEVCVGAVVEEKTKCTDSDGGKDYYVKGTTAGRLPAEGNAYGSQTDHCIEYESGVVVELVGGPIYSCSGDNCGVQEFYCKYSSQLGNYFVSGEDVKCPNGCKDGACLTEGESSTTKPSKCTTYFGDKICDDSKADCGTYYKSGTSLVECDECQTWKDGKLGFECFEETEVEGEAIIDMLLEGSSKTYTINGIDYEVTLDFVDSTSAKFTVNDESTVPISIGKSDKLVDGALITVNEILYQTFAGGTHSVKFSLDVSYTFDEEWLPGVIKDTLLEGTSKTYTINGIDYEVTLDFVSSTAAKFSVNGELTSPLSIVKSHKLFNGAIITVREILYQTFAGGNHMATFTLDASNAAEGVTSQKNTCQNSCGSKSKTGSCYCDTLSVTKYDDYCKDIATYCPEIWKLKT